MAQKLPFSFKVIFVLVLLSFEHGFTAQTNPYLFSKSKPFCLLKFGLKGYCGVTDTTYLNQMVRVWIDDVVEASGAELTGEPLELPFNIEYGYQPFFIIRPLRMLQMGVKMDYAFSSLKGMIQNPLLQQDFSLRLRTNSYIPGVFAYLTLGGFELGGGVLKSFTTIKVNDDFFGYADRWYGENSGYELSAGFSNSSASLMGFTSSIKYRRLVIDKLQDSFLRDVTLASNREDLSLDMSGYMFEMGIYLQFIKLKKGKK